ncbi:MAG: OmpA family protein [Puia sp.]|nr:OmpA family protein [Puia sp.]
MNRRKTIFAAGTVLLVAVFAQPVFAATTIVQEEGTLFYSETVRYPPANAFLIEPTSARRAEACGDRGRTAGITAKAGDGFFATDLAGCDHLPTAHFQLGSDILSTAERQSVLDGLRRCPVSENTPLRVTGYTCSLGSEQENRTLSLHRAWAVANVLRVHGYTVKDEDIQGKGEESPLTDNPKDFNINRRVEITQ